MILKIIGLCWMIVPFFVLLVPNNNTGELFPYVAFSFICGFLLYRAAPKRKNKSIDTVQLKKENFNADKPLRNMGSGRKFENENHKRYFPKPSRLEEFESNYSESLKVMENIGSNRNQSIITGDISDLIRNGKNYPGETTRILTETYFGIGYNEEDRIESMENLINFRASMYELIEIELKEENISELSRLHSNNFPIVILGLSYLEIFNDQNQKEFFDTNYALIYKIIEEEHIKVANRLKRIPVISNATDNELKTAFKFISNPMINQYHSTNLSEYEIIKNMMNEALYDVEPDPDIEMFQRQLYGTTDKFEKANAKIVDLIRYRKDRQGETSRLLTKVYFEFAQLQDNEISPMELLIRFRLKDYASLGVYFNYEEISKISRDHYGNLPVIIFCLSYYEVANEVNQKRFFDTYHLTIYEIIEEEHIKMAKSIGRNPIITDMSSKEIESIFEKISV